MTRPLSLVEMDILMLPAEAVDESVSVKGGDTITFVWRWKERGDMVIDDSHLGPGEYRSINLQMMQCADERK